MARRKSNKKPAGVPPPIVEGKEDDSQPEVPIPDLPEPEISWLDSQARALLMQDIIDGVVPPEPDNSMPTQTIFTSRPEYASYGYANFSSRLSSLRKIVARDKTRADDDLEAFLKYKANNIIHTHNARGYPEWDGSDAQKQLKEDISNGLHDEMQPIELWCFREEYDDFPLKVFRDHIYQEVRTRKFYHTLK